MRDYLTAMAMGVGTFEMAPLSDFVVKETKHRRKVLPQMMWDEWREKQDEYSDYDIKAPLVRGGKQRIVMHQKAPMDYDIVLDPKHAVDYDLEWQPD
jgi:hypothetical protein